jgi:hypothetical protein
LKEWQMKLESHQRLYQCKFEINVRMEEKKEKHWYLEKKEEKIYYSEQSKIADKSKIIWRRE